MPSARTESRSETLIAIEDQWGAHNYHPLDIVVSRASGVWVYDEEGRRYLDCLSAYSALNQGHCHPRLLKVMREQAERVTLTSRAFRNDQLPLFCRELAELCRMEMVLPMNTGAEAVESAIKAARRWGYRKKGVAADQAEIIVCRNNFHGRTTTVISFSSEQAYRDGFGPFTPGFRIIPFGDAKALEAAITPNTCAFLFEPIQCEAGILFPPAGFLKEASEICRRHNVLLLADEIQTGLGRTGEMFACWHEDVQPDAFILGKALSGGFYPVSAVVATREVLGVFEPGSHGSTYGGNPLGCAVAREALQVLKDERLCERSRELGTWFLGELRTIRHEAIREIRGVGLLTGIELTGAARPYCERLMHLGLLCKETHEHVIRIAPPLVISREDLEWAAARVREAFSV
ncbi:MAG TPA: ornithine--oxo-acid transaminase [Bryobacteraceae bacterium]|nr:ornithine--oxo-acid transaminase [Bryobacteraceae bacterium]